jgi:hypothetical protein
MINLMLNMSSQFFCKHNWIWRAQGLECSHCLKRHQLHPSLVCASGPFNLQSRRLANVLD